MGFYVRKGLKAGPFRFNLSTSGLGVSVGVPGFRVGSGPQGNYVTMGRHGVYYRSTLVTRPSRGGVPVPAAHHRQASSVPATFAPTAVVMNDVSGATSVELEPTGTGDIVEQLNAAARRRRLGWWAVAAAFLLGAVLMPWGLIVWLLAVPLCA